MAGALQLDKELHRLVAPHLTLLRRDVRSIYPELNAELTLLQWLCERNGLKPPQPAYPKDEDAVAPPSSPTPTVPPRRTKIPSLPPVSSRSASSSTSAALGAMVPAISRPRTALTVLLLHGHPSDPLLRLTVQLRMATPASRATPALLWTEWSETRRA